MSPHQATAFATHHTYPPPVWYIDEGRKMKVQHYDVVTHTLRIAGSAAEILISPRIGRGQGRWNLFWKVEHGHADASGNVHLSDGELSRCFGLADGIMNKGGVTVVMRMGKRLDAAEQGAFVRLNDYLSIPGPAATGLQGDPCVSVLLTDTIKKAVKGLISDSYAGV